MKKLPASSNSPPPVDTPFVEGSSPAFSSKLPPLPPASPIPAQPRPSEGEAAICQPPHIPDHELIRCIGGGSYGEVWLARSVMGTYRAAKIIHRHNFDHARPFEREFAGIQKFEPISRSHEGLVDLLQVGRNDAAGYFYYVMELADGEEMQNEECKMKNEAAAKATVSDRQQSLLNSEFDVLNYRPKTLRSLLHPNQQPSALAPVPTARLPLDGCIQIGLALTSALAYLHGNGLVHRDIKPSNIIFVGGVPKLADVGLVAGVDEARSYVGTEGFIPPEGPGSPPADLYSLGIVLYVMSTCKSHQDFPEPLADLATQPDHTRWLEFNAVIHQACRAEVRERYQTAEKMHADLELLRAGQSVKRLHLVERRLAVLTRVGLLVGLLAIIAVGVFYQTIRARRIATRNLVRLHVATGTRQMNEGNFFGSLLSFTEALRLDSGNAKHEESHRIRIASVLSQCPKLVGVFQHEQPVNGAVLSPDDRWLLTASDDHTAKVWDLAAGTNCFTLAHHGVVYDVGFSPDGSRIVTTSSDQQVHLWSAVTGKEFHLPPVRQVGRWQSVPHARFSPDSVTLLTLLDPNTLRMWNATTGEPIGQPLPHDHGVTFCAFSPDGHLIVSGSEDGRVRVWDSLTGELRFTLPDSGPVNHASFSPDTRVLATAYSDGPVRFWDLPSRELLPPSLEQRNGADVISWSPEGNRLFTKSGNNSVQIWDFARRNPLSLPITHATEVYHASFAPDGRSLATVSGGNLLRRWNTDTGELIVPTLRHSDWREPATFSSDGRLVVTLHREEVRVWDVGTIEPPPLALRPATTFSKGVVSLNGHFKVVIGGDNAVRTIDLKSHGWLPQLLDLVAPIRQACFGADSEILLTEDADTRARIWDVGRGEPLTPLLKTEYSLDARRISKHELPRNDRPVTDLILLAQLLSGHRIDETGGSRPLEPNETFAGWTNLAAQYPDTFRSSTKEASVWHDQEAKVCEQAWNWWSAIFHLDWLIARQPNDAVLRDRRAYARMALEHANRVTGASRKSDPAIPPRDPSASAAMVDLSSYYNDSSKAIEAPLPNGLQTFAGTGFDVRGIIKLSGGAEKPRAADFPAQVTGIQIGRTCRRLHFLNAATAPAQGGRHDAICVVHYADNQTRVIPLDDGAVGRNRRTESGVPFEPTTFVLAWMGSNPRDPSFNKLWRMFQITWANPQPEDEVIGIDFIAGTSDAAPILVAITID